MPQKPRDRVRDHKDCLSEISRVVGELYSPSLVSKHQEAGPYFNSSVNGHTHSRPSPKMPISLKKSSMPLAINQYNVHQIMNALAELSLNLGSIVSL